MPLFLWLQVIDVSAGIRLSELAPAAVPPLLAEGFDHQNIEACPDYLPRIKEFLAHVEAVAARKHSSDDPLQQPTAAAAAAATGRPHSSSRQG